MMSKCDIQPISGFQSTNLNSKVDNFNRLSDRILRSLGYPFINVEVHTDQLHENISIALEYFSKFAGYTKEYLIFDSNLYQKDYGLKMDDLFTLQNTDTFRQQRDLKTLNKDFTKEIDTRGTNYVATSGMPGSLFVNISALSASLIDGISANEVITDSLYNEIVEFEVSNEEGIGFDLIGETFQIGVQETFSILSAFFLPQPVKKFTIEGSTKDKNGNDNPNNPFVNSFDYDVMDYRKVIDVTEFTEGSTTGINTLFTIEQTLAQQTYFSYAMGNYGFDLISWYTLKNWLETREKLLAIQRSYSFDPRTQILRMYPQPNASSSNARFYGVISCYVERPVRDLVKELWVYQYALALTKIIVGRVRGKYTGTQLFGGGSLNADLLQEGLNEKNELEQQLMTGSAPGQGDSDPPLFFVG